MAVLLIFGMSRNWKTEEEVKTDSGPVGCEMGADCDVRVFPHFPCLARADTTFWDRPLNVPRSTVAAVLLCSKCIRTSNDRLMELATGVFLC